MKLHSNKRSANKSGAVLVTAVAVLLIMSILMTATISYVSSNRKQTNANYTHKQAYLTASTTLKSFVTQIELVTAKPGVGTSSTPLQQKANIDAIKALAAANGGKGTTVDVTYDGETDPGYKLGTTVLNIAQDGGSSDNLVVTAYTTYADVTEKVAAHIYMEAKTKPADFTNTIETIGAGDQVSWDNLNVIGDTAVLNENGNKVYALRNDAYPQGSFYIFGSVARGSANAKFWLSPSLTERRGTFVQISGNYWGEMKCESTMERADGYNYIYLGGKANFTRNTRIGCTGEVNSPTLSNEVDVICSKFNFDAVSLDDYNSLMKHYDTDGTIKNALNDTAIDYVQYGNLYVYKRGTNNNTNGDFVFKGTHGKIIGDLFVEGNANVPGDLTVEGNVTIGGTLTGSINCTGTLKQGVGSIDKTARGAVPEMKQKSTDYLYMPEDLVANSDSTISVLKNKFNALHAKDGTGKYSSKRFSQFTSAATKAEMDDTLGGKVKFNHVIDEDCIWDNVNGNGEWMNGNGNVLIHVTTQDIVILMEDGLFMDQPFQIVVKNDSPIVKAEDGSKNHKYNCYFVSDMNKDGNLKITGTNAAGISQHANSTACSYEFRKLRVYDFDTYVHMFNSSYYNNYQLSNIEGVQPKDSFVFNPSNNEALTGVFTPTTSSIFFFLGEGTSFTATNRAMIQACVYGPQATFRMKTQGMGGFTCCDAAGCTATTTKLGVMGIGVFIVQKFDSDNTGNYIYTKPSSTSALANTKKNDANNMTGFALDRYDHY